MTRLLITLLASLWLTGCASTFRVDNAVQSFARWDAAQPAGTTAAAAPAPPQRYRFERLPSQTDGGVTGGQERLEAWTRAALEAQGWQLAPDAAAAPWQVQVSASTVRNARDPWDDPWSRWSFRGQFVAGNGHFFWSPMFVMPMDMPWYQRQVSLVIRSTTSGQVVYETRASHDGRWHDSPALWQAMLQAALRDFPNPPAGPRQVNIDLPR